MFHSLQFSHVKGTIICKCANYFFLLLFAINFYNLKNVNFVMHKKIHFGLWLSRCVECSAFVFVA